MEVLAVNIPNNPDIVGLKIPNSPSLPILSLYADDTTVVVSTNRAIAAVFETNSRKLLVLRSIQRSVRTFGWAHGNIVLMLLSPSAGHLSKSRYLASSLEMGILTKPTGIHVSTPLRNACLLGVPNPSLTRAKHLFSMPLPSPEYGMLPP